MALSDNLISQFVQLVNDKKDSDKETTVYGKIKIVGKKTYVQLDGSDLLTPVSTTADAEDGEYVTVMIKNHTATVTGNLSSPSARTGTVQDLKTTVQTSNNKITELESLVSKSISTTQFEAQTARIDTLVSENATIRDELDANTATIDTLTTNNATITKQLAAASASIEKLETEKLDVEIAEATYATIENLDATNAKVYNLEATYGEFRDLTVSRLDAAEADIEKLDADKLNATTADITYAKIEELNATNANVNDLEADVANIDTLIFGVASGDTIQTSFANAVIAQLGDAQIKSAMIENIAANKITSGDIITNNVRVLSEDGKLLISDETIQISDDTRVRVQIGKDSTGNYSISIWDADGNLMFSEGGITDSAIKNSIIRDDMVSDTANISAHKLNIDSLFEVINGSTNTINSTRVYLDDEGQSLDVAFKSLSTEVTELGETVTSQGTQLSVVQGQIESKVWINDIDSSNETLTTQYSTLEQEVNSISATVASHTATLSTKADSTEVTEVSDRVSAAETKILQNDSSITALADRTTVVENKFDGYSTTEEMNSAITQSANSITSSVSETYITKTEFDSLEESVATSDDLATVQSSTDLIETRVSTAESLIEQLSDCIAVLVRDGNGESLMTQTEDGWVFSTANIQEMVDTTSESLGNLINEVGDVNSTVDTLQQAVSDLGILNDYVKIRSYEDEPCIELGETDSDFKLIITNTRIMFMEGSGIPAYINNQSLYINKAIVEEELQQGEFVWKARSNGNLGLVWKGATS